jgi:ATP-dependent helicase HrpA
MSWGLTEKQSKEIIDFIGNNGYCGIIAPTGSGKSTLMIEKLYKTGDVDKIFITEPTVPAAESLHRQMSGRLGKNVVGFAAEGNIRYDNSHSIVYCTSGHLRRKMLSYFEKGIVPSGNIDFCSVLVLDEAHSGSIDIDIIVELWIHAFNAGVTVPRLVLASATLSKENTVLEDLPILEIKTKSLPIKIEYNDKNYAPDSKVIYSDLALKIAQKNLQIPVPEMDTSKWLVFCPGSGEVDTTCTILRNLNLKKVLIFPAYSKLTSDELTRIFDPIPPGYRSIIVATNIAEASITIDGLDGVYDSMVEKVSETSASGGFRLVVKNVSKSSSNQRKGRTGRTREGFCYRMCTQDLFNNLPEQREPEIKRVPLTNVIVELLNVGLDPVEIFKYRVSEKRMNDSIQILKTLKMVDNQNLVTESGNFATVLPLGVRNSAIIFKWIKENKELPVYPAVVLASILDVYGPAFYYYPRKEESMTSKEYEIFRHEYYEDKFSGFQGMNDLESLLKMWNFIVSDVKSLKPGYDTLLDISKNYSLNNKKVQELFKIVRKCCIDIARLFDSEIVLGPFNERKLFNLINPIIKDTYYDFIFTHTKDGLYINPKTKEYYKLDHRQAVNITNKENPSKIIALRTAEISGAGKKSSNMISLFVQTY